MIVALDIGGTQMRIACGDAHGTLTDEEHVPTPTRYADAIETIRTLIAARVTEDMLEAISIGVAGIIPHGQTRIARSPHLTDWEGHDLAEDLGKTFNAPVYVHNDVALGGLGEARCGAGKGNGIVAYVAVGTGVGGVRIVDDRIDRSSVGFEIGHQLLSSYTSPRVSLESLVSGSALFSLHGKTGRELIYDPLWHDVAKDFSVGLYNTILHWSPDVVVLGGSICSPGGIEAEEVAQTLAEINTVLPSLPHITHASLGGNAGLVGAGVFAYDALQRAS